ncbi:MAG TPA: sodium:proton antiporter [Acholeplasmatales bacterium]|nr:sodium:proton antiporter [Acholeplasmatales bacterium]
MLGVEFIMFLNFEIDTISLLLPLALILLLSKLLQMGCKRVKMPQVVGMLLAGIIIAFIDKIPGINLLNDSARAGIKFLAEIGVVLIMFSAGLGTNLNSIKSSGVSAIVVTSLGVIVPMGLGFLVAGLFNGFGGTITLEDGLTVSKTWSNLFYGVILTATSVSVTVATLKEMHRLNGKAGTIIISAAILDDIIGVIVLSVVLSLSGAGSSGENTLGSLMCSNDVVAVFLNVLFFFIFTIAIGVGIHYLFKYLNKKKPHTRRLPIFGLAFCFFMAFASEKFFGVADITGAYFAGLALAGIGHHINPIRDVLADDTSDYIERKSDVLSYMIFSPIFFANVGINADFSGLKATMIGFGCCYILAGLLGKVLGCGIGAKITGNHLKDSIRIGIGMMARAEVALICANKGIDAGLVDSGMSTFIVIMIIVSSFVTPLILKLTYKNENPVKEDYNETLQEP